MLARTQPMHPRLAHALQHAGLDARPAGPSPELWHAVWQALPFQLMGFARTVLDYQSFYLRDAGWHIDDLGLIMCNDGKPCGLFPMLLGTPPQSHTRLTAWGGALQTPLFLAGTPEKTIKKICGRLLPLLQHLAADLGLATLSFEEACTPHDGPASCSEWHLQLMAAGAQLSAHHELFTDLRPALPEVRSGFRKSYKPLINAGLRCWTVETLHAQNAGAEVWDEFRRLHIEVAGRRTRGDETWALQYRMLTEGWGFLVVLRDPSTQRMVGAGFFQHTRDEGVYCAGAYDRQLFDKPLGHVVQQVAMERLQSLSIPWYRLGERPYPQDEPAPTDKQIAIGNFKHGFASHVLLRHGFALTVQAGHDAQAMASDD